jgi:hypothetical protein
MNKLVKFSEFDNQNLDSLNENFWEDIKYGLSKLGRYKAGGKIFGKKKVDAQSREEIKKIMSKKSNELLKKVYGEVLIEAPEFPNDRKKFTFLKGVLMYGQFYDSLVAAAKKDPKEEGYLAPDVVNEIIGDLRKVVKKHLDVDLKAIYTTFESRRDEITEEEVNELQQSLYSDYQSINEEEEEIIGWIGDKLFGARKGSDREQKTSNTQSSKFQKTSGEKNFASDRIKGLESNKLPLILAGLGATLGILGWIAQTEWFKEFFTKVIEEPDQFGEKTFKSIVDRNVKVDPNGWSYTIQNNGFMEETGKSLNFDQPVGNLKEAFKFYGGGDEKKGAEAMLQFINPNARGVSAEDLLKQLSDPTNKNVGDIFNRLEGTWGDGFLYNQNGGATTAIAKKLFTETRKVIIKQGGKTVVTTALGAKIIALAPVLATIGISLIVGAVTLKLARMKGLRSSRAKILNDLYQSLLPVEVDEKDIDDEEDYSDDSGKEGGTPDGDDRGKNIDKDKTDDKEDDKKVDSKLYYLMVKNLKALRSAMVTVDSVTVKERRNHGAFIDSFMIFEKRFGTTRRAEIMSDEKHLIQAFKNIQKAMTILKDSKEKGIAIDTDFLDPILDRVSVKGKNLEKNEGHDHRKVKEYIIELYKEIYEFLYGKYSKTLSVSPLYKEGLSSISTSAGRSGVAEKIARFAKRSLQFKGEGFYGGMGEFGADLKDFNESLEEIMKSFK